MKIEIGESLMLSWLKHVKNCKLVQLNWKTSPKWDIAHETEISALIEDMSAQFPNVFKKNKPRQLLSQAEIDALGVNFSENGLNYYAIDVAFHSAGLGYGSTDYNVLKVSEKMLRTALILYAFFSTKSGEIIFATPKINPVCLTPLTQRVADIEDFMRQRGFDYKFTLMANKDFKNLANEVVALSDEVADTSELFLRSCQLYIVSQKS